MRTRTLRLLFCAASLHFAAASCSDDLAPAAESQGKTPIDVANLQGEELEKYAYGCEYYAEDTTEKVETSASGAYFHGNRFEAYDKWVGTSWRFGDPYRGIAKVDDNTLLFVSKANVN